MNVHGNGYLWKIFRPKLTFCLPLSLIIYGVGAKLVFHVTEYYTGLKFGMVEKLGLQTCQISKARDFSRSAEKYYDDNGEIHRQL
jgi:hypothetical protein